jgi:large subunit ribosomal protein L9
MKVILKAKVKGVGNAGEVKDVSDGYARNFLLPKGLAVTADANALKSLEQQLQQADKRDERELTRSQNLKEKIENLKLSYKVKAGEGGRLFGAVTSKDIADEMARMGVKVDRRKIMLEEPIRQLGSYELEIRLHPQVTANLTLAVETD